MQDERALFDELLPSMGSHGTDCGFGLPGPEGLAEALAAVPAGVALPWPS